MNERIKELGEQAENYADKNFKGEPTWSEAFESKFAELIIDECIKMAEQAPLHHCYTTYDKSMSEGAKHDIVKFMKLALK